MDESDWVKWVQFYPEEEKVGLSAKGVNYDKYNKCCCPDCSPDFDVELNEIFSWNGFFWEVKLSHLTSDLIEGYKVPDEMKTEIVFALL